MPARRIIPCLDLKGGRVVKGVRFADLRDAGDPVELAKLYEGAGADELVFLDITATLEARTATLAAVRQIAAQLTIPFTVGGGVNSNDDIRTLLQSGCDKVALNSAAVRTPELIAQAAAEFGSQCIVVAIDARAAPCGFETVIDAGRTGTGRDAVEWAREAARLGAGELLVTSIDRDGTKSGFDLPLLRAIRDAVNVPVIASGGAGRAEDFAEVFKTCDVDAALAASLFHYGELSIGDLKRFLTQRGISIRPLERDAFSLDALRWDERGLLPVVIQDASTRAVLTLAYANRAALQETLDTKQVVLFSRSRNALWHKGETSGNTQAVLSVSYDCDMDALLYCVDPHGPACHTGALTCFHNTIPSGEPSGTIFDALGMLQRVLRDRKTSAPADSYVARLYSGGVDAICKKIGEEATEVILAAKGDNRDERIWEAADLLFHLMVLLQHQNIDLNDVGAELLRRHTPPGA